jgi:zinc transport system permease protein
MYFLLLLGLTALSVVILSTVVGLVMVIALLTLPAAVAGHFSHRLWGIMAGAVAASACFTSLGLGLSYGPDLPAGASKRVFQLSQLLARSHRPWTKTTGWRPLALAASIWACSAAVMGAVVMA